MRLGMVETGFSRLSVRTPREKGVTLGLQHAPCRVGPLAAAVVLLSTARADAAGLCDTRGHFCIQLDTTSARVCTPMLPEP